MSWFRKGGVTPFEKQIIQNVREYGCHINWIFDKEDNDPSFAYSIGFTKSLAQPEVIIFGLPKETSFSAINDLFALCQTGQALKEGERIYGLFGDYDCIVRMVDESWIVQSYFASALWFHRTQMDHGLVHAAMIVWPDAAHNFPWEASCAEWVRRDQPALYEPRICA